MVIGMMNELPLISSIFWIATMTCMTQVIFKMTKEKPWHSFLDIKNNLSKQKL
jgi:hypothetical protein